MAETIDKVVAMLRPTNKGNEAIVMVPSPLGGPAPMVLFSPSDQERQRFVEWGDRIARERGEIFTVVEFTTRTEIRKCGLAS